MKNELKEDRNELARLDYSDWLAKTIDELNRETGAAIFCLKKDIPSGRFRLIIDIHCLAFQLAKNQELRPPLDPGEKAYKATINMVEKGRETFGEKIQEIKTALSNRLIEAIRKAHCSEPDEESSEPDEENSEPDEESSEPDGESSEPDGESSEVTIDELIKSMLVPLASMPKQPSLFAWQFPSMTGLSSQDLTLDYEVETPTIRSHKVTIEINSATRFREFVVTGLENYVQFLKIQQDSNYPDFVIKNVRTSLDLLKTNGSNELCQLEKLLNQETIGRLKREAEVTYLESLANIIGEDCDRVRDSKQKSKLIHQFALKGKQQPRGISLDEASFYLRDYSRRLRSLEKFINDKKKPEAYYEVTYQGVLVDIQELFSGRDAFSELPLLGKIDGCIGETDDPHQSITSITFGLKFKLNGRVSNPVLYDSSFVYGLEMIKPDSKLHNIDLDDLTQERRKKHIEKIVKFFVLYYFAFACPNPLAPNYCYEDVLNFDVIGRFTEEVLPQLKEEALDSDEAKKNLMIKFVGEMSEYLVTDKLEAVVKALKEYLKKEKLGFSAERKVNIGLSRTLLLSDLSEISNTGRFFGNELSENLKECLKYVFISAQVANKDAIIQFPVTLTFETDNFYRTSKKREFDMSYQIGDIQMLPVFYSFASQDTSKQFARDKKNIEMLAPLLGGKRNLPQNADEASEYMSRLVFPGSLIEFKVTEVPLEKATERGRFIYELTWRTLGFIILDIMTSQARKNKNLFVCQWLLHQTAEAQTTQQETLIHQIVEEWSYVLSDSLLMNSQGIVMPNINRYKIPNAKCSLYSVLPQEYKIKNNNNRTIEPLLIVMVSSNKCDARSSRWGENYIANLTGEVVAVEPTKTGLKVSMVKTLAGNYRGDELHRCPAVLRDTISDMYLKGFRHVIYIASSPFSEHLRVTDQQNELFFMSPELIKYLKIADDLVIYPVLYDSYSALRIDGELKEETLYVQDVRQLSNVFNDPNRSQVVFFNLFTGKAVERDRIFYNTVTTYSTLLNAHPGDVIDVNKVMDGLIKEGELKNNLMLGLTLLHYSKYEKSQTKAEKSFLKLDPLNDIIGDNAIGRSAAKSRHCISSVQMNSIAFLTEVYNALIVPISEENAINSNINLSHSSLLLLDEIKNYLVDREVSAPDELPQHYVDCLVESYSNPMLKERVESIIAPQWWVISNGDIVPF
ncbi:MULTISPECIES: hypothetical protein [unclassified Microcoleus]|uniref:hypothetical protein n=1 Tax=unclassified Microcoleus TaxID=2642155 RepID=UPI002FD62378